MLNEEDRHVAIGEEVPEGTAYRLPREDLHEDILHVKLIQRSLASSNNNDEYSNICYLGFWGESLLKINLILLRKTSGHPSGFIIVN